VVTGAAAIGALQPQSACATVATPIAVVANTANKTRFIGHLLNMICRLKGDLQRLTIPTANEMDYEKRSEIALHTAYESMSLKHPKGKECTPNAMNDLEEISQHRVSELHSIWGFGTMESITRTITPPGAR
jgi:hypothetical protein